MENQSKTCSTFISRLEINEEIISILTPIRTPPSLLKLSVLQHLLNLKILQLNKPSVLLEILSYIQVSVKTMKT